MKHIYYSELLDKDFDTEEACLTAEKNYKDEEAKKKAAAEKEESDRVSARENIEKLTQEANAAYNTYVEKYKKYKEAADNYRAKYEDIPSATSALYDFISWIDSFFNK